MKRKLFKCITLTLLLFSLGSLVSTNHAEAKLVLESYFYDYNTQFGTKSNYHGYVYTDVPNHYELQVVLTRAVSSGWNYIRYQVTKTYG